VATRDLLVGSRFVALSPWLLNYSNTSLAQAFVFISLFMFILDAKDGMAWMDRAMGQ
jgi:hypothetical protein